VLASFSEVFLRYFLFYISILIYCRIFYSLEKFKNPFYEFKEALFFSSGLDAYVLGVVDEYLVYLTLLVKFSNNALH
jgi:hypothetical protein